MNLFESGKMLKPLPQVKKLALAVSMTLFATPYLSAQEMQNVKSEPLAQTLQEPQKVTVTGSNIKRIDSETAVPLQVITRAEIVRSGAITVKEILDNATSNDRSAISDLGGANSWASGASGVSLRSLGINSTLTLVNGRRMPSYGFADGLQNTFVNVDAIPAGAIERIEILRDGASAVYGSSAIAGVVNIITRRDYKGVELNASAQQSTLNRKLSNFQTASITGGIGNLDSDGYNVFAHLEAYHRGSYKDREIFQYLPAWYLKYNPSRADMSTGSYPGNYVGRYPSNYADKSLAGKAINVAAPGCAPALLIGGLCRYDYWKDSDANPAADRVSFMSAGRLKISEDLSAFAEVQFADTKSTYHTSIPRSNVNGTPLTWYDSIKNELQYFTDPKLPVGHPNNPYSFPIGLNYRFTDYPDMFKNIGASQQYRVMAGFEGRHFGWEWDAAIGSMGSSASQKQHLYRDRYAYTDAIVNGSYKFGQQNSRELLNAMFPEMGSHGRSSESFFDLKGTRELMKLDGGALQLATGVDFRHERFEHKSAENILQARIVQFSGVSIYGTRNVSAAFAEINAPFTKKLEANFAVRADKSGSTELAVVPKSSVTYVAADFLKLRATASQGFRAPSLPETGNGGASWFTSGDDPKRCETANAISEALNTGNAVDKAASVGAYYLGCGASFPSAVTPNQKLKPEKSNIFTTGFVLQLGKETSLSFDYYNVKRNNEIAVRAVDDILANEDKVTGLVQRGAITAQDIEYGQRASELSGKNLAFTVGPIQGIQAQYANISKTKVSGYDLGITSRWDLKEYGKLSTGLDMTYRLNYQAWELGTNAYSQNYVGYRGEPQIRAVANAYWSKGDWGVGGRAYITGATTLSWGMPDTANNVEGCAKRGIDAGECKVGADFTMDLNASYSGFKNTEIGLNIFNLFNRSSLVQPLAGTGVPLRARVIKVYGQYRF